VQLFFLPQVNTVIYFHPCYNICVFIGRVTKPIIYHLLKAFNCVEDFIKGREYIYI
jgi:hypothetical protein